MLALRETHPLAHKDTFWLKNNGVLRWKDKNDVSWLKINHDVAWLPDKPLHSFSYTIS